MQTFRITMTRVDGRIFQFNYKAENKSYAKRLAEHWACGWNMSPGNNDSDVVDIKIERIFFPKFDWLFNKKRFSL